MLQNISTSCGLLCAAVLVLFADRADLELNQKKLAQWQQNPEQWALLRRNAQFFQSLPNDRQQQILAIDQEVHDQASSRPNQLHQVMDRYLAWLEGLEESDRKKIREAPDKNARLEIIQQIREQERLRYYPRVLRERVTGLKPAERSAMLEKLRQEDRQRQRAWTSAGPFIRELDKNPLPSKNNELPRDAQEYLENYLKPRAPREEFERLAKMEGQWPGYLQTLLEIGAKYPPALMSPDGPRTFRDLPGEVQKRLKFKMGGKAEKLLDPKVPGTWPDFGSAVAEYAHKKNVILPHELWPTSFAGLSLPVQDFIKKKLEPTLSGEELVRLKNKEGHWPDYPHEIQELAKAKKLAVPWLIYGGSLGRLAPPLNPL